MTITETDQSGKRAGESRLLIDGALVESRSGATFENIDPSTEESLGVSADASFTDMDAAIAAARRAFDQSSWCSDQSFRARCLQQLQDGLRRNLDEISEITVSELGAVASILPAHLGAIEDLSFEIGLAESYEYEAELPLRQIHGREVRRIVRREPYGVVGAITPWNFPLMLNLAKVGPALAAGNTVVLKPAPDTPWSATIIGRIIAEETDIPAGVVNIVASSDHNLGEMLTRDPRVDAITFTGSTATGRRVMASGAATVKPVFLELGGKSAGIVLDDADFSQAVVAIAGSACTHAGQGCALLTRLLLPASRYDEGVELAASLYREMTVGDPRDPTSRVGPLISDKQRTRVLSYLEKGMGEGARVLVGGGAPAGLEKGFYVEPTLFSDVDPRSTIAQEEIFGPVQSIIRYEDEQDAIRIANDSIYGLSGSVWSGSAEHSLAVARQLRTGTVALNGAHWVAADTPFGGQRQSGIGREHGIDGFEEFLDMKVMAFPA